MFNPLRKADEAFAFLKFKEDAVSSLEIIGRGRSGVVYKAKMPDGRTVAIKKIVRPMESELVRGDTTTSSLNYTRCWNLVVGSASYTLEIREPIGGTHVNTRRVWLLHETGKEEEDNM
ncbi:leucine-rich repeat receptor-like serine/threonine/tyrosine-protein kinase SOBIR1 [Tanacetum coccineum]